MNVTKFTLWGYRKAGCVAQAAVCTHVVSIACAQHHAPYSLESVIDGYRAEQDVSGCAEMLPECAQCRLEICLAYQVNVLSRHCRFLGTVDTTYE
jgi:hypothetical protein